MPTIRISVSVNMQQALSNKQTVVISIEKQVSLACFACLCLCFIAVMLIHKHYILSSTSLTNTVFLLSFSYHKYYILPSHFILYNPHKYYILPSHNPGILLTFLQRIPYFRYFSYIFFTANPINPRFFKKSGLKNGQFSFFKNF